LRVDARVRGWVGVGVGVRVGLIINLKQINYLFSASFKIFRSQQRLRREKKE